MSDYRQIREFSLTLSPLHRQSESEGDEVAGARVE